MGAVCSALLTCSADVAEPFLHRAAHGGRITPTAGHFAYDSHMGCKKPQGTRLTPVKQRNADAKEGVLELGPQTY